MLCALRCACVVPWATCAWAGGAGGRAGGRLFGAQGTVLATLKGPSHQLLRLERTVLNTVSRLSGIATRTR